MFIEDENQLIDSVKTFSLTPEFWRVLASTHPKYFLCFKENNRYLFGLSKYCAHKNVPVLKYISDSRYNTDGHTTQKHISQLLKRKWIPFHQNSVDVQNAFKKWFFGFYSSSYNLENILILQLRINKHKNKLAVQKESKNRITPEQLQKSLKLKMEIGKVGQEIAYKFEIDRLRKLGVRTPEASVQKTYELNVSAGFDLLSMYFKKEKRYIEVKSTLRSDSEFYITKNEIKVLESLNDSAFIYFVQVYNTKNKSGEVVQILKNPIRYLKKNNKLTPILFLSSFDSLPPNTKS